MQTSLSRTLANLALLSSLISHLSLLSPNEILDDIQTSSLRCLLVDALRAHCELLLRTKGAEERKAHLEAAKACPSCFAAPCLGPI
jgi:hypothetical protein